MARDTQEGFASWLGIALAVQIRRELGQVEPPAIALQLYRVVIAAAAIGGAELLDDLTIDALDYTPRSEARSYLRIAEQLTAAGLAALIPRTP
tara:strand:+ start:508 stop:786 length:279 start_codon:yes stop_codon:yes gene_type:complete